MPTIKVPLAEPQVVDVKQNVPNITLNTGETYDMSQHIRGKASEIVSTEVTGIDTNIATYSDTTKLLTGVAPGSMQGLRLSVNPDVLPLEGLQVNSDQFHSLSFVWDVATDADTDYNGVVAVRYRKSGESEWKSGLSLLRTDYTLVYNGTTSPRINQFSGALMFLSPGTTYECELVFTDPDGIDPTRSATFEATTRAIPTKPTGGNTYYVIPGSGGGTGTSGDPFQGLAEANSIAQPGDIFNLRDGTYTRANLDSGGSEGNYVVYQPDTGASPVVRGIGLDASHLWIDNLEFEYGGGSSDADKSAFYVPFGAGALDDIVITGNTTIDNGYTSPNTTNFSHGILDVFSTATRWIVMDNTFVGPQPVGVGTGAPDAGSTFRGMLLRGPTDGSTCGHVIAYNSSTRFSDGMNAPIDADVWGNQVFDQGDDGISTDGGRANLKVWGNRVHDVAGSSISFQPQRDTPWYFCYNQLANAGNGVFKFRATDRCVYVNNTFIGGSGRAQYFMRSYMRNNVFVGGWTGRSVAQEPGQITFWGPYQWGADWRTDHTHNAFTSTSVSWYDESVGLPDTEVFGSWALWATDVGLDGSTIIQGFDPNVEFDSYVVSPAVSLTLDVSSQFRDAGDLVNNLADWHGSTPDRGAHQFGETLPYGPRDTSIDLDQRAEYWVKH